MKKLWELVCLHVGLLGHWKLTIVHGMGRYVDWTSGGGRVVTKSASS